MTQSYISPSDVTHINVVTPSAVLSMDPSSAVSSAVPTTRRANRSDTPLVPFSQIP